jgi:hypothetical protein
MQKPELFSEQNESSQGIIFLLFHIHHSSLNAKNRASTALGHRHHSNESDGLGYARPGVVPERSRGAFSSAKKSVPERSRGRSPSEVEGICLANDDNSFSFHRNIATKQIAIFECLQFMTPFKYIK